MFRFRSYVDVGGHMSFGVDSPAMRRRAAVYVAKILDGAKAADLPIERVDRFQFVLNAKTADPTPRLKSELTRADRKGVVVRDVVGLSPGIEAMSNGDVVVEVNRHPTPDLATYRKVLTALPDGEVAWLFAYRPRPGASYLAKLVVDRGRGKK